MADNLSNVAENLIVDHVLGTASWTPSLPLKVRLMTANGSDSAAGTELGTSGGYTAGGSTITFNAASGGSADNAAEIAWTNMPACTLVGAEVWDSHGTPKRILHGAFADGNKVVNAADTFRLPASSVVWSLG